MNPMNSISNFKTSAPERHCYKNGKTWLREKIFAKHEDIYAYV